jgi:mitogen-activated protein kinase kinase kinase
METLTELYEQVLAKNSKTMAARSRAANMVPGADGAAEANSLTGTPMYLSPETVKGERRGRKGAMDIWALGCVILECATGHRPWSAMDNEWCALSFEFRVGLVLMSRDDRAIMFAIGTVLMSRGEKWIR